VARHGDRPTPAYPWSDVLSPTLGVRYRVGALSALADVAFTPTPVPAQTGRTNYVDNDRISGALGSEYGFRLLGSDMNVGVQVQAHQLRERHQAKLPTPTRPDGTNLAPELVKDEVPDDAQLSGEPVEGAAGLQTNNPGWPGFASEGWLVSASVNLKVML
jgi:long-subunit fatty acid transport protein